MVEYGEKKGGMGRKNNEKEKIIKTRKKYVQAWNRFIGGKSNQGRSRERAKDLIKCDWKYEKDIINTACEKS